jgi:hypothetical protein
MAVAARADSLNTPLIAPVVLNVVGTDAAPIGLIFTVRGVAGLLGVGRRRARAPSQAP